jgi:hypothetical protein
MANYQSIIDELEDILTIINNSSSLLLQRLERIKKIENIQPPEPTEPIYHQAAKLELTSSERYIHCKKTTSSDFTAKLIGMDGRPVPGKFIRFTVDNPELGSINEFAETNQSGEAKTIFQSNKISGRATIIATQDGLQARKSITIYGAPSEIRLYNDPSPEKIYIKNNIANHKVAKKYPLRLFDAKGRPVVSGFSIEFDLIKPLSGCAIRPSRATTNSNGMVTCVIVSGYTPGIVQGRATYHGEDKKVFFDLPPEEVLPV